MSGHSKWAQIKHKKAVTDVRRGQRFSRLIKEITVAARLGGGDPTGNPRLRVAIAEAKAASVARETIERAIQKGSGELAGESIEEITFEAYGPGGVAVVIQTVTDNHKRTVGELRHLLERHGGNLGTEGSVAWMFHPRGHFVFEPGAIGEEGLVELALELGAEDVDTGDPPSVLTAVADFHRVRDELERRRLPTIAAELALVPTSRVALEGSKARQALRLIETLEDHEDVQHVWTNLEVPEDVLASSPP